MISASLRSGRTMAGEQVTGANADASRAQPMVHIRPTGEAPAGVLRTCSADAVEAIVATIAVERCGECGRGIPLVSRLSTSPAHDCRWRKSLALVVHDVLSNRRERCNRAPPIIA